MDNLNNITSFEEFQKAVQQKVAEIYGEDANVLVNRVVGNNDTSRMCLNIIMKGNNYSPSIYLEELYSNFKEGKSNFEEVIDDILRLNATYTTGVKLDTDKLFSYEQAKDSLQVKLVNLEKNRESLKDVPYKEILDLAATVIIDMGDIDNGAGASCTVRTSVLKTWGVDFDTVFESAVKNLKVRFESMTRMIERLQSPFVVFDSKDNNEEETEFNDEIGMYVITNKTLRNGASSILASNALDNVCKKTGKEKIYIIPSSIHECIVLTADTDPEEIVPIIREVNSTQVQENEVLSDKLYIYDSTTGNLDIAA